MKTKKIIEDISFEDYLKRLEKIVNQLEEGELTLDESIKLYEEGMNISKSCLDKLNIAKQKVEQLVIENEEKYSTKSFSIKKEEDTDNDV